MPSLSSNVKLSSNYYLDEADYDLKNCADHGGCYLQLRQKTPSESCIIYSSVDIKAKSSNCLIIHT